MDPEKRIKRIEMDFLNLTGLLQVMAVRTGPRQRISFSREMDKLFRCLRIRLPYFKESIETLERLVETYERTKKG